MIEFLKKYPAVVIYLKSFFNKNSMNQYLKFKKITYIDIYSLLFLFQIKIYNSYVI